MKKRLFGLVFALVCAAALLWALPVSAEETSGKWGENLTWVLDSETGTLTISGQGEMAKVTAWQNNSQLRRVIIKDGVTKVADGAFRYCTNLETVVIPESVTSIGKYAFEQTGLKTIELHDGITDIGTGAFQDSALTKIRIPAGITEIVGGLCRGCSQLTQIEFHDGVTTIGQGAFSDCSALVEITIPNSVTTIQTSFSHCTALVSVTIPDSVTAMGSAFDGCTALKEVKLGSGLQAINKYTFRGCTSLETIEVPDNVTSIGTEAFSGCSALEKVRIGAGVDQISEYAFIDCTSLTVFEISADNTYFCAVDGVIYTKDKSELVRVPNGYQGRLEIISGVVKIGRYAAYNNKNLTALILPDTITEISHHAFDGCDKLESVNMPAELVVIDGQAFYQCKSLREIVIPAKVERIEAIAFSGCKGLKTITFLGDLPYISSQAFFKVKADAYYPEGNPTWEDGRKDYGGDLTWVQDPQFDAYSGMCGKAVQWRFDTATQTLHIFGQGEMTNSNTAPWWDYREQIMSLVIDEGVTSISHAAFSNLQQLKSVSLPNSLTTIGGYAFNGCFSLTQITLPDSITYAGEYAFQQCGFTEFTIPTGMTAIGYGMFSDCRSLKKITLHENITSIGSYAFFGCISLTEFLIPDHITTIGDSAFRACYHLEKVTLGNGITEIPGNVFMDCASLQEIQIPDSVTSIGGYAFSGCDVLKTVIIGAGVSEIDTTSFQNCPVLQVFTLSAKNPYFYVDGAGVLYTEDKTELVMFPFAFSGEYEILPGTLRIAHYAAYDRTGITGIVMPDSITLVDDYAFCGCRGLKTVRLSESLEVIGTYGFGNCGKLTEIVITGRVTEIKQMAFSACMGLKKVTFRGRAPTIASAVFSSVTTDVYYPGKDSSWEGIPDLYGGILTWFPVYCEGPHVEIADDVIAPTCTEDGKTSGSHCGICGETIIEPKIIPATGHDYTPWETVKAPTVEEEGLAERTCSVCAHVDQKTLSKLISPDVYKPTEGTCGENLTWHFADGVLTISGTGEMYAYDRFNMPPWMDRSVSVTTVIIEDGVTSISHKAFIGFSELAEVVIPGSVKTIGGQAFKDCVSLTELILPEGLEKIGDFAFEKCTGLISVSIPSTVTRIDMDAFDHCTALETIYFHGDAPQFFFDLFLNVTAVAYYPSGNETWTPEKRANCGGNLTWTHWCAGEHAPISEGAKDATCTQAGKTDLKYCSLCGTVLVAQEVIPATGHSYGEWAVTQEPTVEAEGQKERTCTACGAAEQRAIAKLDPPETRPTDPTPTYPTPTDPPATQQDSPTEATDPGETSGHNPGNGWIIPVVIAILAGCSVAIAIIKKRKK